MGFYHILVCLIMLATCWLTYMCQYIVSRLLWLAYMPLCYFHVLFVLLHLFINWSIFFQKMKTRIDIKQLAWEMLRITQQYKTSRQEDILDGHNTS